MGRRTAAGIIFAALVAAFFTGTGAASASQSSDESHLRSLLNGARSAASLAALADKTDLDQIAQRHSREMAAAGRIYHSADLPGDVPGCWTTVGENVGAGGSVQEVHDAFMDSPTHRSNVLSDGYNEVGIGVVTGDDGRVYVTETFAERRCSTEQEGTERKVQQYVRAQTRRTPPPRVERAHLQPAPSAVAAASQNVDLLTRMMAIDAEGK